VIIDTAMQLLLSLLFGLLLLLASLHKISRPLQFRGILAAYRLLPPALLGLAAKIIPLVELSLGLAWLSGLEHGIVAAGTASLLALYAVAMAINISRGNTNIDCGCSFSSGKDKSGQRLSSGLVSRNLLLALLSLTALLPGNGRELGVLDYGLLALACCALTLTYAAYNQLIANRQIIRGHWQGGTNHG
jgi:hypothetical protein